MQAINSPLVARTIANMLVNKDKTKQVIAYMEEHYPESFSHSIKAYRIKDCCNMLRFANYWKGEQKIIRGNFCKYDKMCVACATRRSIKMIQHFMNWIYEHWLESKHWYHITLTIRHSYTDTLMDLLDKIMKYKIILTQSVRNSKRNTQQKKNFFSQFNGLVSSIEITHGEKNWRHPHIHLLACSDVEIPVEFSKKFWTSSNKELQRARHKITGDSFSVGIRKIDISKNYFDRKGIGEVFKYAVKFSTLEVDKLAELIHLQQSKQYRFYATTGILRGREKKTNKKLNSSIWSEEAEYLESFTTSDFVFDEKAGIYRIWNPNSF